MATQVQYSFSGGEIGPDLVWRADLAERHRDAAAVVQNWMVTPQGPLERRPGTYFYHDVGGVEVGTVSKSKWKIIPFEPSTSERYQIVFTTDTMYVYQNGVPYAGPSMDFTRSGGGILLDSAWSDDPDEPLYGPVQFATTDTLPEPLTVSTNYWINRDSTLTDYEYGVYSDADLPMPVTILTAGTGTHTMSMAHLVYRIDLPEGDVQTISYAANQRALYFRVNEDLSVYRLTVGETGLFNLKTDEDVVSTARKNGIEWVNGPWETANAAAVKLTVDTFVGNKDVPGSTCTLTAASLTDTAISGYFTTADSGKLVRIPAIDPDDGVGVVRLPLIFTATNAPALCTIVRGFAQTGTTAITSVDFNLGLAWEANSWSTPQRPRKIAFAEGRLWHAGQPNRPTVLNASKTLQYENYSPTNDKNEVQPTSAIDISVLSSRSANVQWMESALRSLVVGTDQGVFAVKPPGNQYGAASAGGITPTNIEVTRVLGERVGEVDPVLVGPVLVAASLDRKRLYGIEYDFGSDRYASIDLSLMAYHLVNQGIKEISYVQDPWKSVFVLTDNGEVLSLAFDRGENLLGWARHIIAGTDAAVMAQATSSSETLEQSWMVVKRTINSGTKYYLERYADHDYGGGTALAPDSDINTGTVFLDCATLYAGGVTSTITGLGRLEGESVSVLGNNGPLPGTYTVSSGTITLNENVTWAVVGLAYSSKLQMLPAESFDGELGKSKRRKINRVSVRFTRAGGGRYGTDFVNMDDIEFRKVSDPMDSPVPMFTGLKELPTPRGGWGKEKTLCIENSSPLPMTVCGVSYELSGGDR